MRLAFLIVGLVALASQALGAETDARAVVDVERAFAAEAARSGWVTAFKAFAAPGAIVLQPDPINAHKSLASLLPDANTKDLNWWPLWAGIAASGDLGFTTGPYVAGEKAFGHYFTVWRKQSDGSWKWIFDGGAANAAKSPHGPETPVSFLPPAADATSTATGALEEVSAIEASLAEAAKSDAKTAYLAVLAEDARVMGSREQPAVTATERETELARRAPTLALSPLGATASEAGDLAFTYGAARWMSDGEERRGHYVRIWQRRDDGWKLVFDELLAVPAPRKS